MALLLSLPCLPRPRRNWNLKAPTDSPLSPSGIKCFVHEGARIDSEDAIGCCYVTADNVRVQAAHFHLCHPFICDVAGCHYFISDRELRDKGRHCRAPLKKNLPWKERGLLPGLPKVPLRRSQAQWKPFHSRWVNQTNLVKTKVHRIESGEVRRLSRSPS